MQVKLLLGDYAYLYHGELILDEIHKQIQQLTKLPYTLKWRDTDDEMISVVRAQDLKYCIDITKSKQNKSTLRLFIYEKTGESGQARKQRPTLQQSGSLLAQSDLITPQAQSKFFPTFPNNNTSQQTFGEEIRDSQQKENNQPAAEDIGNFLETEEKIKFCKNIVSSKMEEFYPGLNQKILKEKQNPLELIKTQSEFQFQTCYLPQFKRNLSAQEKLEPRFHSEIQDTPILGSNHEPEQQFEMRLQKFGSFGEPFEGMQESIPTKKIENQTAIKEEDFSNFSQSEGKEEEDFFCDYCSEQIPGASQAYVCPECGDLHICIGCFDTFKDSVHFHKLIAKIKQS